MLLPKKHCSICEKKTPTLCIYFVFSVQLSCVCLEDYLVFTEFEFKMLAKSPKFHKLNLTLHALQIIIRH